VTGVPISPHPRAAAAVALLFLGACAPVLALSSSDDAFSLLTAVLAAGAVAGVLGASKWDSSLQISGAFVCFMLAVAFAGPAGAFVVGAASELGAWPIQRYRSVILPVNIAGSAVPSLLAGIAFDALTGGRLDGGTSDTAALALVAIGFLAVNFVLVQSLAILVHGGSPRAALHPPRELLPSLGLTVALTLAIAAISARSTAASLFAVLVIVAFNYMSRLVVIARQRAGQYAALSWGVLSALVRSLDRRDGRTARHSAAVAAFARDIADECGMSKRDAELAHTAGLLHDIGRFALPDRVMERQGTLTEDDWEAIRLHPELGADMLKDLGVYGPVAQIVRAHHERIDGRGYPDRLKGDEIPEIARIIAVAEVYDTLTAHDTYRDRMTSFQAITELRRVAGRQLDARYVEALVSLLSGRGMDYRHADTADFDSELAIHGRIADSVSTDSAAGSGLNGSVAKRPRRRRFMGAPR
jgi:putative nucleotidyltransferase with HDIG domain